MEDRKTVLLKACLTLFEKQNNSPYVLNLLSEIVHYDDADCDGYCLMEDIKGELCYQTDDTPLEDLDFSARTYNCLKRHGINFKSDIESLTENDLMKVRNLGRMGLEEIKEKVNLRSK
jgi:DNA-directed RNA polymerase alpha subunit